MASTSYSTNIVSFKTDLGGHLLVTNYMLFLIPKGKTCYCFNELMDIRLGMLSVRMYWQLV